MTQMTQEKTGSVKQANENLQISVSNNAPHSHPTIPLRANQKAIKAHQHPTQSKPTKQSRHPDTDPLRSHSQSHPPTNSKSTNTPPPAFPSLRQSTKATAAANQ
jgi:hypothetical protein